MHSPKINLGHQSCGGLGKQISWFTSPFVCLVSRRVSCFISRRMSMDDTNSLIEQRKAKLAALRAKGIDPFANRFTPDRKCNDAGDSW